MDGINPLQWNALSERLVELEQANQALQAALVEHENSLGWVLMTRASRLRRLVFREGTLLGKTWGVFARATRSTLTLGPVQTLRNAGRKVGRVTGLISEPPAADMPLQPFEPSSQPIEIAPEPSASPFLDLPWKYTGSPEARQNVSRSDFQVLLVAHSACRTGAPHCLLRLVEYLGEFPNLNCWVVLREGGELAPEFSKLAPTLELKDLAELNLVPAAELPLLVATAFQEYAYQGMAVCNTMVVNDFHEALRLAGVPVLSWIHELPRAIDIYGGPEAMKRIAAASSQVVVPARVVGEALAAEYGFDPARIETIYNGLDPRTEGRDRNEARASVRKELGLPSQARILLGCGTVDQRKGAELFVQSAARFLKLEPNGPPAHFVWVGLCNNVHMQSWLEKDIRELGLKGRVHFVGLREDPTDYFLAADLFLLTSREDPCPFAMLEAMEAGLPVVAFAGSGGAVELSAVAENCVPYLDIDAMCGRAIALLADAKRYQEYSQRGKEEIRTVFTWPRFVARFRRLLETRYFYRPGYLPTVSVVVPNYRHAKYLETRLRSIFAQTVQPLEIVFLDDASPDDSLAVVRRLELESPVPMQIVANEANTGRPFQQWMKGVELAQGDLVWIAESDDDCRPDLLERLVPRFLNPEVRLAYGQSMVIGPQDEQLAGDFLDHTNDLSPTRWRAAYEASAGQEVERALCHKNTIPNVSAVLFRREGLLESATEPANLRYAGDWSLYARHLLGGKIAYVPQIVNRFRRSPSSVTHQAIRGDLHTAETLQVRTELFAIYPVSADAMARSLGQAFFEYAYLSDRFEIERPELTVNPVLAEVLNTIHGQFEARRSTGPGEPILVVIDEPRLGPSLPPELAEANRMARTHPVFVCYVRPLAESTERPYDLAPDIVLLEGTTGPVPWLSALDAPEAGSIHPLPMRVRVLRELIRFFGIKTVYASSPEADALIERLKDDRALPLRPLAYTRHWSLDQPREPQPLGGRALAKPGSVEATSST